MRHTLLLLLLALHASAQTRTGRDYAVFFYVTDFQPGISDIPFTKGEAEELAGELTTHYGFTCSYVRECKKADITTALAEWNKKLAPEDQVLFFFSMHGYYDANADRGYLIPADGKSGDQNNYFTSWLSYDDLRTYLAPCKAGHVLIALDACYSGAFGIRSNKKIPGGNAAQEAPDCATRVRNTLAIKGRQFVTAGKISDETPGKSVFVQEMLATLRTRYDKDGLLPLEDLAFYLHKLKNPEPEDGTFTGHKAGGDFVFVRKGACGQNIASLDRDGDGVPNATDKCPDEFGLAAYGGCPDPTKKGNTDSDYDGIPDERDGCPNAYGTTKANGCPDRDNDGVPDQSDKCRDKAGEPHWQGCPDTDGDGLPDHEDQCPNQKGSNTDKGCPPADRDNDGVPDKADKCPDKAGKAYLEGCPEPEEERPADGLLLIKGGTYTMGCTNEQQDCGSDEEPTQVTLSDFYLGQHEVTQKLWRDIMGGNPSNFKNCDQCPVERVSWDDVQTFLQKLNARYPGRNYRLPTEAEWEYAAREGGKAVLFGNGKNVLDPKEANFDARESYKKSYSLAGNYRQKTTPAGSFAPNALGLYDMAGNVWEWCSDRYGSDYYKNSPSISPTGPATGSNRVVRGGSWSSYPQGCRVADRNVFAPGFRGLYIGFRLARTK